MLIAQATVGTIASLNYSEDWDYFCNNKTNLMYGLGIILFFQLNFLISWKLYTATYDLSEFVIKHQLPSEQIKKRNRMVYSLIWATSVFVWMIFLIGIWVCTKKDYDTVMWKFNFVIQCLATVIISLHLVFLILSLRRINKILKVATQNDNSSSLIKLWWWCCSSFITCLILLTLIAFLNIYLQGDYGLLAVYSAGIQMITFAILLTLYYLMLTYKNPDFKLSTKVQADGRVVIVGIDQYDHEVF